MKHKVILLSPYIGMNNQENHFNYFLQQRVLKPSDFICFCLEVHAYAIYKHQKTCYKSLEQEKVETCLSMRLVWYEYLLILES